MFGRPFLGFNNWNSETDNELELIKRAAQIKKQYEQDIPKALSNLEKNQKKQIIKQNKAKNVLIESLEPEYPLCKVNLRQNSEDLTPSLEEQIKVKN
ncbi:hypothetical protein BpHYR1_016920 [Brachionus plicatilis]|uniref:Uncharacterized protein n=1 Tax=Brachionus plicatilis TaxID=10195 RepID=A0A3M7PZ50_BRAPC|nr:hypothetical protein BpHYR1_016920 [Brachionus plicatilis]